MKYKGQFHPGKPLTVDQFLFRYFSSWYSIRMINKYPLNENSKSLKLATEPPENPILKEKRDANLPKPSHKSLHWEIKLGLLRGGNRASRKKNSGLGTHAREVRGLTGVSPERPQQGVPEDPPRTSDPPRRGRHPHRRRAQSRGAEVVTPTQTQRKEGH